MTGTHPTDGSLPDWQEVEEKADWRALLLGNGLSINVWPKFEYGSLFEQAKLGDKHCNLDPHDLALFEQFETENFEIVLGNLDTAIRAEPDARPRRRRAHGALREHPPLARRRHPLSPHHATGGTRHHA